MSQSISEKKIQEFLEFDFGVKISNRNGKGFKVFKGKNILKNQIVEFFVNNRREEVCKIVEIFNNYKIDKELIKELIKMDLFFILLLEGWSKINLKEYMNNIDEYVENQGAYYVSESYDKSELYNYNIKDFSFNIGENFTMEFKNNKIVFFICNQEIATYDKKFTNLFANIIMDGKISPQSLLADLVIDATNKEMNLSIQPGEKVTSDKIYTGIDEFKSTMKDNFLF